MTGKEAPNKSNVQKFVRYAEGAKMYSIEFVCEIQPDEEIDEDEEF